MSNELLDIQEQLRKELAAQRDTLPAASAGRISVKGKKFNMPDGQIHEGPMSCIILDHRWTNSYFEGAYNAMAIQPPVCFAKGKIDSELKPASDSTKPQSKVCADCPQNQWGTSGKGKACKNGVRLAILPPVPVEGMTPWIIDIAPTGLTGYTNYLNALQNGPGLMSIQVITELNFAPGVDYPKLTFTARAPHEHLTLAFHLRNVAQGILGA